MKIYRDMQQGSAEWRIARMGIPTASGFKNLMITKGRGEGGTSKSRTTYINTLAGERLTGMPGESYSSDDTNRGNRMEPEARTHYELMRDVDAELVSFITLDDGSAGCSPDSLIGADGMLEIKTTYPEKLIAMHDAGKGFPSEHKAQTQGNLWIAEREWIDIYVYWPKIKPFEARAYRDEKYIAELEKQCRLANEEIEQVVERMKMDGPPDLRGALEQSLIADAA